jgi:CheY-like chemotaxis protein
MRRDGTMKVLIAEDSAVARAMVEMTLASLGYECISAEDGDAAWELFLESAPDVVISDWMMPGMNGDVLHPADVARGASPRGAGNGSGS